MDNVETGEYEQLSDGDSFEIPNNSVFRFACCDCGLVHRIAVVTDGKIIGIALERDVGATNDFRKKMVPTTAMIGTIQHGECNG